MDPDATLKKINRDVGNGELAEACHSLIDLIEWFTKGGHKPPRLAARLDEIRNIIDELNPNDDDDDDE